MERSLPCRLQYLSYFLVAEKIARFDGFVDAGNVYDDDLDLGELRYSVGMSAKWLSPFGALSFSLAMPINDGDDDEVQTFQFAFGSGI